MRQLANQIVLVQPLHDEHEWAFSGWSATTKNLPFATSCCLLTQLCKFLEAGAAGAKVIQPLLNLSEPQLAESDASKHCRVRTSHALWIWELAREASRQIGLKCELLLCRIFPILPSFLSC